MPKSELNTQSPIANTTVLRGSSAPRRCLERLPGLFFIIGALLAVVYAFIVPPFEVTDEDRHLWRAFSVSDLKLVAPAVTQIPASFLRLHERFPPTLKGGPSRARSSGAELATWLWQPLRSDSTVPVANQVANLYSFVPYVPGALVLRMGRLFDVSPLGQIYAGRLTNAAFYVLLVYLALRILPDFRLLLLMISLTPMSLNLAASFSADCVTLAIGALLTAFIFRLAFDDGIVSVRRQDLIIVPVMLVLLTLCKFNVWMSLLVLLIPAKKFGSRRRAAVFAAICLLACCLAGFGWQRLNASAIAAYGAMRAAHGAVVTDNIAFLQSHPLKFLGIVQTTCFSMVWAWLWEFVGVFGWVTVPLPGPLFAAYVALLILAAWTQSRAVPTRPQRAILATFVALTVISIHALMWVFQTDTAVLHQAFAGPVSVSGIQGRYFLPIGLPALAIIGNRGIQLTRLFLAIALGSVVVINILALITIWRAYY
jgi:uncharacterized membrane protein